MKRWAILLLSLVIVSCAGVPKEYLQNDNLCRYNDPIFIVSQEEMTLDVEKYDSILSLHDLVLVDNDTLKLEYYKHPLEKEITNKQTNKQTKIIRLLNYTKKGRISDSYYVYQDGFTEIGKETFYDEQGTITKVIDHEAGYRVCWAEAIAIVQKRLKRKLSRYDKVEFIVARNSPHEFPGKRPVWAIGIAPTPDDTPDEATYYQVDGVTGKYIGKYKLVMVEY